MRFFAHDPRRERRKGLIQLAVGLVVMLAPLWGVLACSPAGVPARIVATGLGGSLFGLCLSIVGVFTLRDAKALGREEAARASKARPLGTPPVPGPEAGLPAVYRGTPPRPGPPDPDLVPALPVRRLIACSALIAGLVLPMPIGLYRAVQHLGPAGFVLVVFGLAAGALLIGLLRGLWVFHPLAWSAGHVFFLFCGGLSAALAAAGLLYSGMSFEALVTAAVSLYFLSGLVALYALRRDWYRRLEWMRSPSPLAGVDKGGLAAELRRRLARR